MEYLSSHSLFETGDLDESRQLTSQAWLGHKSDLISRSHPFHSKVNSVQLSSSRLSYVQARGAIRVTIEAGVPDLPFTVYFSLRGRSSLENSHWRQVVAPEIVGVPPLETGLTMITSETSESLFLHTSRNGMKDRLSALLARPIQGEIGFHPCGTAQLGAADRLSRLASNLSAEVAAPDGSGVQPLAVRQLEELLLSTVLCTLPHRFSAELHSGSYVGSLQQVRQVEEFIQANLESPLSIVSFSKVAGISSRALHEAFRIYRGYAPMEFLRRRRLAHVRSELKNPEPGTTIARVATKWGFAHLGRFSHEYEVEFHERPQLVKPYTPPPLHH